MTIFNKKIVLCLTLAILFAPAAISAKVYFLESEDESAGALGLVLPCRINYPLETCPEGQIPKNFCPTDSRYFQTCGCDSTVYQYDSTNCTGNKTLGGTACDGKYASCTCDATKYMYDSTNCGDGKVLGGNSCDGKYETCGCDSTYSKTCSSPMIGSGSACDGKYQSCTCPSGYLTCNNGGAAGASQCTEEDGTVKWSECKPNACPSGTTDYSALGDSLSLIVSPSEIQTVGTKKCVSSTYCSKLGFGNEADFSSAISKVKCPLDTSKVYNNDYIGSGNNVTVCIPSEEICRVNCAGVEGTLCKSNCQLKCEASGSWTPTLACSYPLFANEECNGTLSSNSGCGYLIPAELENQGICRKWSCGGSNTTSVDSCIERCSDPLNTDCTNCKPFVCLLRDDVAVTQP